MQVHVKTPHTEIDMKGEIPEQIISMLKKVYGKKVTFTNDDEYINIEEYGMVQNCEGEINTGENYVYLPEDAKYDTGGIR